MWQPGQQFDSYISNFALHWNSMWSRVFSEWIASNKSWHVTRGVLTSWRPACLLPNHRCWFNSGAQSDMAYKVKDITSRLCMSQQPNSYQGLLCEPNSRQGLLCGPNSRQGLLWVAIVSWIQYSQHYSHQANLRHIFMKFWREFNGCWFRLWNELHKVRDGGACTYTHGYVCVDALMHACCMG